LLPIQQVNAQYYFYDNSTYNTPLMYEFGGSLGVMNCLTDVGGKKGLGKKYFKDLNIGNNQLNGSIYFGAMYKEAVGLRIEGTFGKIKAYDSILKNVTGVAAKARYDRNLSFTSHISEISAVAEFYPLFIFINWASRDNYPPGFSPYLLGGVGYFSFNPQTILNGRTVDLQPLSTEGQGFAEYPARKPYKLHQINFPVGAGIKFDVASSLNVRLEFLYRITKTDYLDDLSIRYINQALFPKYFSGTQLSDALALSDRRSKSNPEYPINPNGGQIRGNPKNNDAYFNLNIKLGLTLGREKILKH
jgi:opacity protein-like surface antigen